MPKKIIYLAGPIADCSYIEAQLWRDNVMYALRDQYDFLNPMVRDFSHSYRREDHEKLIVEGDKRDIDNSDIVLAHLWKKGTGTTMEIIYAWTIGKTVLLVSPEAESPSLSPWLSYHATHLFTYLSSSIAFLARSHAAESIF